MNVGKRMKEKKEGFTLIELSIVLLILFQVFFYQQILYNDYPNNVIKYSAKDFNGCQKGCELYFLIETDQVTQDPALLTHVTFNIDQKWEKNENGVNEFFSLNRYIKGTIEDNRYKY